ncbi:hypothetical protein H310_13936 [Aphanomyces invadans]|uniref:Uncharacterized protein n=1 Tax=Aphanomyces invadans TaxID=157072 RepID=A0A024TBY6_9STRA|nr:hypothetical protein H310_13936 [Aphanomyces invadans]ETV91553.1 hypothetical protein H310_13936 [Aphanomyces invadans]|eukprot:XP_008879821.1 hypothetical protein H310_13936 [Aphanomyces invadans]
MWEQVEVRGDIVGLPLRLRVRFIHDGTCSVEVMDCPDEVGFDNIAIWDTSYCVRQRTKHLQGFISIAAGPVVAQLRFVGNYDPDDGTLIGKWFDCLHVDHTTGEFHFERTDGPTRPPNREFDENLASLTPLVPGQYLFRGAAVGGNGRIYHSRMVIQLRIDGTVTGTVQERLYPQTCIITGQWSAHQLGWHMKYAADGNVSEYLYYGTPTRRQLRGLWQLAEVDSVESLARESGHFDYALVAAHRQWSRDVHHTFPTAFRRVARTVLLSKPTNSSTHAPSRSRPGVLLPADIWCQVFSFVHSEWWTPL